LDEQWKHPTYRYVFAADEHYAKRDASYQ